MYVLYCVCVCGTKQKFGRGRAKESGRNYIVSGTYTKNEKIAYSVIGWVRKGHIKLFM